MKITMLGVGNGFSPGVYDNNGLLTGEGGRALIDCGTTAWVSLDQLKIPREEIDEIFLTHLHFDHSGGVESAALYSRYVSGKRIRLIVPKPIVGRLWDHVLKGTIENSSDHLNCLEDYFDVSAPDEGEEFLLCGVKSHWIRTQHVNGKFSCGLVMGNQFFYTSDMVCNLPLLETLTAQGVTTIFHDCQLQHAQVHADFATLCTYPEAIRKRMKLMHHGLNEQAELPDANGMSFLFQHKEMPL